MKKVLLIIIILTLFTGCKNEEEQEKNSYLTMKTELLETKKYTQKEKIPCNITINIKRLNKEQISYEISLSEPTENMNKLKALAVHNYYTEDLFPSIGLFDKKGNLLLSDDKNKKLKLKGKIETTEDIDKLNLKIKVLIKYQTDDNKNKTIYYKMK